jgi:hypothetical protein
MTLTPRALATTSALLFFNLALPAQDPATRIVEIPSAGCLGDGEREALRQALDAAWPESSTATLALRARPAVSLRALQHVLELALESSKAPCESFTIELGNTVELENAASARFELGFPRAAENARDTVQVKLAVIEPGMAVLATTTGEPPRIDWLSPQNFLEPVPVERFLRGTTRAQRSSELALAPGTALPAIPEAACFATDADRSAENWPRAYQQSIFRTPFTKNSIAFERQSRSPLRILLYSIERRAAGQKQSELYARAFDLESLEAALRRFRSEALGTGAANPELEIGLLGDPVVGWSLAKPAPRDELSQPLRAVLISKPMFAPFPLAAPTFDVMTEFEGTAKLHADRRQAPLYYDALGWSVQLEDLAEVVARLRAAPTETGAPRLEELFDRPRFALDSVAAYVPDALLDAERRLFDLAPVQALKRPPAKK